MKVRRHSVASVLNKLSRIVNKSSTMILPEEQVFIENYILNKYTDTGHVVELGSFTGGGTKAIASCLQKRNAQHIVHAFDLWEWNTFMDKLMPHVSNKYGLRPGDSFDHVFDETMQGLRVHKHKGDLLQQAWTGESIEFLFVDAAKNKSLAYKIALDFFPSCNGTLVQQDFLHEGTPWDKVVMYQIRSDLEFVECVGTSAIFRITESIDLEKIDPKPKTEEIDQAFDWALKICGLTSGLEKARAKAHEQRLEEI